MSDAVQQLADRAAIRDVLLRYARGVDRNDLDLVASCFVPDAAYEGALGIGTVHDALTRLRERLAHYERTMHVMANQLIELDGDRAASETYCIAYHLLRQPAGQMLTVAVRYLDDFVRHEGVWRIRRRCVVTDWSRTSDA